MAINKIVMAAIKAISYAEFDIKKHYKIDRVVTSLAHPSRKHLYQLWDHKVMAGEHEIPVRIFFPKIMISRRILLYFHGGGWVSGNIDTYTKTCGDLAADTGCVVVSVDYRLAPEYPFPCGLEDCYLVAKELFAGTKLMDTEVEDVILIGDSAGGNLAAAVSLMGRDRGAFKVNKQILVYPATYNNHSSASPFASIIENGTDYLLTSKKITDYMALYIQEEQHKTNPYFAPLLCEDLSDQPETLIITAEFDPLRDEGEAYGRKLRAFGNSVNIYRMPDGIHGFFSLPIRFGQVEKSHQLIKEFLDRKQKYL